MSVTGRISQIIGPVVDVHFNLDSRQEAALPSIHEALEVTRPDGRKLVVEVQQHIGEDTVRCVAMDSTDGLRRGLEAVSIGSPVRKRGTTLQCGSRGTSDRSARRVRGKGNVQERNAGFAADPGFVNGAGTGRNAPLYA